MKALSEFDTLTVTREGFVFHKGDDAYGVIAVENPTHAKTILNHIKKLEAENKIKLIYGDKEMCQFEILNENSRIRD